MFLQFSKAMISSYTRRKSKILETYRPQGHVQLSNPFSTVIRSLKNS